MVGNFAGKDVGAMKSIMPLVENARQLRLQEAEGVAFNNMVAGMSPEMQALAKNAPPGMRNSIIQSAIANLHRDRPVTGGETKIGPNGALLQLMSDGSWKKVSGAIAKGDTIHYGVGGNELAKLSAKHLLKHEESLEDSAYGAAGKYQVHSNMLRMLEAKDPTDSTGKRYKTKFGLWQDMTHGAKQLANSVLDSYGGEEALESLGFSDTAVQTIFQSNNKDLSLLAAALMKGNLSEKELDFSVALFSRLRNSREANIVLTKLGMMKERSAMDVNSHMLDWRNKIMESNPELRTDIDLLLRKYRSEKTKFMKSRLLENDAETQLIFHDLDMIKTSDLSDAARALFDARPPAKVVSGGTSTAGAAQSATQRATATHNGKTYQQMVPGNEDSWELVQ
jgi:hypothetical protein